ncbi:Membrane-associated guanylate kinase, WW and PDZ domain-containing protein 3 [Characodon lateralis]|uniref:Membrane-associated guanylate kinase, WW and PDZ domain-containing protein 3 n=1 Tax=Characodon lateralis TaxID=208331 RepID=A0ABU7EBV8_9TELE|nr:Membrane-associated guanylate kinase, WW and PDZ domain-containing protein 3 [Characodon lateralis]
MSKTLKKKKHWFVKVQECSVSWGGSGELTAVVEVLGGAELGEFPHIGRVIPEAVVCHTGRLPGSGDVLLEVNGTPVSGLTNRDTLAVIRHFREPLRLKTVRPVGPKIWSLSGLGSDQQMHSACSSYPVRKARQRAVTLRG